MSGKPFEGLGDSPLTRGLAWAYRIGQGAHAALRLQGIREVPIPLISIGNIVVGGTGKTPLAGAIANHLGKTRRVAIVSRGYGGYEKGPARVAADADPRRFGDEPVELAAIAKKATVWVARDRIAGSRIAMSAGAQTVLLDDGFSYRGLKRDVDLLVFDERGIGNGMLLPAGPLREPATAIQRAHAVLLRGASAPPPGWNGPTFRFDVELAALQDWDGNTVPDPRQAVAAAGIGWPQRFFDTISQRGIELEKTFPLTDHAPWPPSLIRRIEKAAAGKPVIITGKDAVKLQAHRPPGVWLIARHSVRMDPAFWPWIEERAKLIG